MKKIANHKSKIGNAPAFTLVELLTVIAIIGILAAMLLPVLTAAKTAAKKAQAKTDMSGIVTAIEAYDQDYSRFPLAKPETDYAAKYPTIQGGDFTCGLVPNPQSGVTWPAGAGGNKSMDNNGNSDNNSNVVSILMDMTAYPNGVATLNVGHQYNPKQVKYLNAKLSGDSGTGPQPLPGVDNTGVYRDPWGNPYIITMNTSYSLEGGSTTQAQGTSDLYYCQKNVSQSGGGQTGYNGLFNATDAGGNGDHFLSHSKVMVWSAGPDGKIDDASGGSKPANQGFNKDNVLSWQ